MTGRKSATASGIFVWYGEGSYFRPHWQDLLNARGFSDIDLDPSFKARNLKSLLKALRNMDTDQEQTILMTVGEIPLSLKGFRSLPSAKTAVFMTDDEWRFHSVGRYLTPYFDMIVTNTPSRVEDYEALGFENVIHTPYAANTSVFRPLEGPKKYEVVMIGAAHPDRIDLVRRLISEDIPIKVFGSGWGKYPDLEDIWDGFLSTDEMVSTIATAKIVINSGLTIGGLPQIKGRIFETAACRTFQITQQIPGIDLYYNPGSEIETYMNLNDLVDKTQTYLADDKLRDSVANAAYDRTVNEHTWESRLETILEATRIPSQPIFEPEIPLIVTISSDTDERHNIETAVKTDNDALLTFSHGSGLDDPDRIKLLAHGLKADMQENIWMNLASFDAVDGKRRVVANANIKAMAEQSPELLPLRSIMLSARRCLELLPNGKITQSTLISEVVPILIKSSAYRHIDLDTGLFEESASGKYAVGEIYSHSDQGLWDVRTKPYARELLSKFAFIDALKLSLGILRRRNTRKNTTGQ